MRANYFAMLLVGSCLSSLAHAQSAPPAISTEPPDTNTQVEQDDASGKVPDIIVTADRFAKSVQTTPIAVSVVTGDQITREGRTKIDDVLKNEPAVIVQGAAKGFLVSIRGLGLSLPPQLGQGAVATNYDGAFSSRAENASAGFYDLDRVEVLRGPQSTLYGRNAVGGVVNIISRDPTLDEVGGYASAEVGNYSLLHAEGAVNLPVSSTVALRVSGAGISRDGYISNGHDDNKAYAGRAKLLFQPSGSTKLVLGAEYTHLGGKGPGAVPIASILAGNRDTTDVSYGYQDVDTYKFWSVLTAQIGPGVLFVEPAYQHTHGINLGAFGGNFAYAADPKLTRQKSLEVRYSSAAGSPVEWNVGYYHYDNYNVQQTIAGACEDVDGNYVVPAPGYNAVPAGSPPGPSPSGGCLSAANAVATSYNPEYRQSFTDGFFGQITVPLGSAFRLIGGMRYTWERVKGFGNADADAVQVRLPTQRDGHFNYRAGLEFDVAQHSLLYATATNGYRQGGFGFGGTPYNPERMRSYEVGSKNRFLDDRLLLNGTLFYYDYQSFQLVIADFSGPLPRVFVPTMPAREFGAELETALSIGTGGRVNASLTYLNSRLDGLDGFYVGLPFPNSPTWQFKAGAQQAIDTGRGTLTPRVDFRWLGDQLVYPEQTVQERSSPSVQKRYATGDLSIVYAAPGDRFSLTAYIKNVNDKFIKQSHFFGYSQLSAPRTYGLVGTIKF